jgi:hypothetical protein
MSRRTWGLGIGAAALVVVGMAGCQSSGMFDATAFHSRTYPYTIRYADPEEHALLSSDWVVENYYADASGKPTTSKRGRAYRKSRDIELADGHTVSRDFDVYDVMLVHRASDAVIWLRSIPLSPRQPGINLRVLAAEYADGMSGSGFYATDLGPARVESQTYASRVLTGQPVMVAGLEAYEATLEVANVDQLKLDPTSRAAMIRVVFVRTPFKTEASMNSDGLPVLWMIGYANNPVDFEAQAPDFTRFLGLVDANGSHGFTVLPPVPQAAPPPAPSASAAPITFPSTWTTPSASVAPTASASAPAPAASSSSPAMMTAPRF